MMRFARLLRHAFTTPLAVRRAFPPSSLTRITQAIAASEERHSGQIRCAIESALPWSYLRRDAPARQRALMVFSKLRVWDTEGNNGVLIHLELADHSIEVVADRGIAQHIGEQEWKQVCDLMREHFRRGQFETGVLAGVDAIGARLQQHFPVAPGLRRTNELPDTPTVL